MLKEPSSSAQVANLLFSIGSGTVRCEQVQHLGKLIESPQGVALMKSFKGLLQGFAVFAVSLLLLMLAVHLANHDRSWISQALHSARMLELCVMSAVIAALVWGRATGAPELSRSSGQHSARPGSDSPAVRRRSSD